MLITSKVQETLNDMSPGRVFTIADFNVPQIYQPALVKSLSRLVIAGSIRKVAKGRYYKPRQSVFGTLQPPLMEVVKDFLELKGKPIGYITGTSAFAQLGLTTQISSAITIATNKYRRPLKRLGYNISFLLQINEITRKNIPLLLILDALKLFREIPATSPDDCVRGVARLIDNLSESELDNMIRLAENYSPYVRALLGAILESLGKETGGLAGSLNGLTNYKLPVSIQALPTKLNWKIV